jgi:hypothetical protein
VPFDFLTWVNEVDTVFLNHEFLPATRAEDSMARLLHELITDPACVDGADQVLLQLGSGRAGRIAAMESRAGARRRPNWLTFLSGLPVGETV